MKDKLITLLNAKSSLQIAQQEFKKILFECYPVLMKENITEMRENINAELELLLSSCTKTASARIVIPFKGSYKKDVVLTRKPGLKQSHESYAAFKLTNVSEIDSEGNLILYDKDNPEVEKKRIGTSILKKSGQILQDKLISFFSFMEETIALTKRFDDFVPEHCWSDDKLPRVKAGNHRIKLKDHGFELEIYNEYAKKDYDKYEDIDAEHIVNYERDSWEEKRSSISMQDSLMTFVRDFELIDGILKIQEERKDKIIKDGIDLKDRLLEYNKPYKILRKLLIQ